LPGASSTTAPVAGSSFTSRPELAAHRNPSASIATPFAPTTPGTRVCHRNSMWSWSV